MRALRKPHPYAYAVLAFIAGAGLATAVAGAPKNLPDVALGSSALLHLERASVILIASFLLFIVVVHAWRGELPDEISKDGFKYSPVDQKAVEVAQSAAELKVVSSEPGTEDETRPDDLVELRLKLEAKLAYIGKILLRPPGSDGATFVTIGSLSYDGFLSDREARTASQILTMRDEELDTLPPALRRDFLLSADTVVKNIRASVFFGLVRTTLKRGNWEVRDLPVRGRRRPDLVVRNGQTRYRIVSHFSIKQEAKRLDDLVHRLRNNRTEVPGSQGDIVVLPDRTKNDVRPEENPTVLKFAELKDRLDLRHDPRSLV